MNDFNLLPSQYQSRWKVQWVPIIIVATIVACAASILLMEWNLSRMRRDQTTIETSRRRSKDTADLEYLSTRAESLRKDYGTLESLITDHPTWSNLLVRLSENTPEDAKLDSVSINAERNLCNIQGSAPGSPVVMRFKQSLENLSYFDVVAISAMARNPDDNNSGVVYEISCEFCKDAP
jgi:hypothetical protein